MRKLERIAGSKKYLLLSVLLLIGAIIFVVINQVDYLSKFATAIVALALLVPSIIFAWLGFYRPPSVPLRWASMATVVVSAVVLIFVASSLITSLTEESAPQENGIAKEADALAPARAEAEGRKDQESGPKTSTPAKAQSQAEVSMPVLFRNVNIFDGVNEELAMGMNVLVVDNLISQISAEELVVAANTLIIDGDGRTLMPGLIDGHAHLTFTPDGGVPAFEDMSWDELGARSVVSAKIWLHAGFTTVRDIGGPASGLKKTVDSGLVEGPRIYPSGALLSQTSGHADFRKFPMRNSGITGEFDSNSERLGFSLTVDGRDAMLAAVRQNLMQGATQIKLMTGGGVASQLDPVHTMGFLPEEIEAAVAAAADWGTYVAVHVFSPEGIQRSLNAGVRTIEHGVFIDDDSAELLNDKGAYLVTQMTALSPLLIENPALTEFSRSKVRIASAKYKDYVEVVKRNNVKLVFMTDAVFGFENMQKQIAYEKYYHAELFGNYEMLKSATSVAGEMLLLTGELNPYPHRLGVIEEGAYADILLVDGNPLEDIFVLGANTKWHDAEPVEDIPTIRIIMKDGKIYKNTLK